MKYLIMLILFSFIIFIQAGMLMEFETFSYADSIEMKTVFVIQDKNCVFEVNDFSIIINENKNLIYILDHELEEYKTLPLNQINKLIESMAVLNTSPDSMTIGLKKIKTLDNGNIIYNIYDNNKKIMEIEANTKINIKDYNYFMELLSKILVGVLGINDFNFNFNIKGVPEKIISYNNGKINYKTILLKTQKGDFSNLINPPSNYTEE